MGWQPPQRLPCKGSWRRSRLRGALPLCAGSVLQNPAEPRSVLRRGRCLHRPVDLAPAQTLRADENHRPLRRRGVRRSAASGDPERYLRGKAPHPSVCACGASTSPCRGGFTGWQPPQRLPCKGSWRRSRLRGALPLCAGSVLQNPAEPRSVLRRGRCLHRPVDLAPAQTLRADENHRPPPAQGHAAVCRLRRPGKIFAGQGAAPLRLRLRRIHLPLQGRLYGAAAAPKAPLQGELAAKPTEGVHCRFAQGVSCKIRQSPAPSCARGGAPQPSSACHARPPSWHPPHENPCSRSRPPQKNPPPCAG